MFKRFTETPFKTYHQLVQSGQQKIRQGLGNFDQGYEQLKTHRIPLIWNGWMRPTASLLMLVRFSLLVAILFGYLLVKNLQAQELLRTLVEDSALWPQICFGVAAVLCAFMVWYWARVAFSFHYDHIEATHAEYTDEKLTKIGVTPEQLSRIDGWLKALKRNLPPTIGASVFGLIAWALYKASKPYPSISTGPGMRLMVWGVVFLVAAVGFFLLCHKLRGVLNLKDGDKPEPIEHLWPRTRAVVLIGLALTIGLTVAFAYYAADLAPFLGTATIVLLFAAALISNGTFLVLWAGERWRIPVIGFLVILFMIVSFVVDNHRVRQHGGMSSYEEFDPEPKKAISYAELTSFQLYYNNWIKELEANHAEGPIPVFIISAEGGGIRAAYWTALILSFLQDKSEGLNLNTGDFARHIFAISGVSGGSLGAATFAGPLASRLSGEERSPTANAEVFAQDREGAAPLRNQAHCVLEKDFLAPTVGVMLFPDFFQRFVPWSFLNDRAVALETSWERAWDDCTNGNLKFSGPFELLWAGGRAYRVPLLFLNSTVVETGQRMITSPIPLEDASFKKAFSDALETTRTVGHNVSLSTVVHTSARFTYVSPAGTVYRLDLGDDSTEDDRLIRVVDGGYFENSGAVTASELLSVLETAAVDRSIREEVPRRPILPIIIHISNDPIQAPDKSLRVESKAGGFLPEVFSPVEALLNVRPARGYQARAALAERVQSAGSPRQEAPIDQAVQRPGIYVHFRLCEYEVPIPLGWTLSDRTRTELQAQLSDDLIGGADHPARPAVSGYHKVVISRIMNALEKGADLPVQERRTLDNYEQCKPQS